MFIWTISDIVGLIALFFIALVAAIVFSRAAFRQWKCAHDGSIGETSARDATCHKCGKNLGFIGRWRDDNKAP